VLKSKAISTVAAFVGVGCFSINAIAQSDPGKHAATKPAAAQVAPAGTAPAASAASATASFPSSANLPAPVVGSSAQASVAPAAEPTMPVSPPQAAPAPAATQVVLVPPGYALVPINNVTPSRYDEDAQNQRELAEPPPYEEGEPVPSGYRAVKESRRGLVIAGSVVGGVAYGFSIVGATGDDFNHKSGSLLVPVVGPWLMLALGGAKDECQSGMYNSSGVFSTTSYRCDNSGLRSVLVLDGLTQVAGAAMLIVGVAYPRTRLVRRNISLSVLPIPLGRDGYGVGAVGQF